MVTTQTGKTAELLVADRLKQKGYKILAQNWRTKVCEIDIIAQKDHVIYLVEVKYRKSSYQGDGFEYITQAKLKKLNFACQVWSQKHNWAGDIRLIGASVDGPTNKISLVEIN